MSKILAIEVNGKTTDDIFTTKNIWNSWEGIVLHTQKPIEVENDAYPEERDGRLCFLISNDHNCCENFGVKIYTNENKDIDENNFVSLLKKYIDKTIVKINHEVKEISNILYENISTSNLIFDNNDIHGGFYPHYCKVVIPSGISNFRM